METYGQLTVLRQSSRRTSRKKYVWCLCSCCGREIEVLLSNLKRGNTTSCGRRHGLRSTPLYTVWKGMRERCNNPNHKSYKYYGGRGIVVCTRWNSFQAFWDDMHSAWAPGLTLDRKDNNGNYEPTNCQWTNWSQQMKNREFKRPPVTEEDVI